MSYASEYVLKAAAKEAERQRNEEEEERAAKEPSIRPRPLTRAFPAGLLRKRGWFPPPVNPGRGSVARADREVLAAMRRCKVVADASVVRTGLEANPGPGEVPLRRSGSGPKGVASIASLDRSLTISHVDVAVVAGGDGESVRAHRAVLAAQSSAMKKMLEEEAACRAAAGGGGEAVIVFAEMEGRTLRSLMEAVYRGTVRVGKGDRRRLLEGLELFQQYGMLLKLAAGPDTNIVVKPPPSPEKEKENTTEREVSLETSTVKEVEVGGVGTIKLEIQNFDDDCDGGTAIVEAPRMLRRKQQQQQQQQHQQHQEEQQEEKEQQRQQPIMSDDSPLRPSGRKRPPPSPSKEDNGKKPKPKTRRLAARKPRAAAAAASDAATAAAAQKLSISDAATLEEFEKAAETREGLVPWLVTHGLLRDPGPCPGCGETLVPEGEGEVLAWGCPKRKDNSSSKVIKHAEGICVREGSVFSEDESVPLDVVARSGGSTQYFLFLFCFFTIVFHQDRLALARQHRARAVPGGDGSGGGGHIPLVREVHQALHLPLEERGNFVLVQKLGVPQMVPQYVCYRYSHFIFDAN